MENTGDYNILSHLEQKCSVLKFSSCLMSLNAMSLSLVVDACRTAKFFELLLEQWQECLPLGEAYDVNFSLWGQKTWEMIKQVGEAYKLNGVSVNIYEYETDSFVNFKELQQAVGIYEATMQPVIQTDINDVPKILVCSLRELGEVLMEISEFLNSPHVSSPNALPRIQMTMRTHTTAGFSEEPNIWTLRLTAARPADLLRLCKALSHAKAAGGGAILAAE